MLLSSARRFCLLISSGPDAAGSRRNTVPATVRAVERGPFLLRGDLRIRAADGSVTDTRAALCRCTRSARQPFCDAACDAPEPPGPPDRPGERALALDPSAARGGIL